MSAKQVDHVCSHCRSPGVLQDAWGEWDVDTQRWVLNTTFDRYFCPTCDGETRDVEVPLCSECLSIREEEEDVRVEAGMKCGICAYGIGTS